ncbi:MAG TPA: short-chain dehydrogenase [Candidatus Accumulibacter sp.]|nr:short-chain dehydrogenase [Accumulibacter sp.]
MPPLSSLIILTGASRGLGLAMARQCLTPGRGLLCVARQPNETLTLEARAAGVGIEWWAQDLSAPLHVAQRLERWLHERAWKGLSEVTLINNAALIPPIGPIDTCPPEALAQTLRVGLEAPMLLTAAFLRATGAWIEAGWRGPRKVLNLSSGLGRRAMAAQAPYCAAKAGLDHFTRCTALDEARRPHGARLLAQAPGVIATDMQEQLRAGDPGLFPDRPRFQALFDQGLLDTPEQAAAKVLAWLNRPDFGNPVVADVRDA